MTEPERRLAALAAEIDWPETPDLELRLEPRPEPRSRVPSRRALVLALALLVLALGIALAVPPARAAILRFFHLGAVAMEIVPTLPYAQQRPLAADVGRPVTPAQVERDLGFRFELPPLRDAPQLYERDRAASILLVAPVPALLTELKDSPMYLKKLAGSGTGIEWVDVNGIPGLWISGQAHVVIAPTAPPRLAGNVLIWQRGSLTYRLEGRLTKAEALQIARSVRSP
jgi:hypothetical protein